MSYNMNESRPKNIGLANVLRRAVRKITINEKNLLIEEKINENNDRKTNPPNDVNISNTLNASATNFNEIDVDNHNTNFANLNDNHSNQASSVNSNNDTIANNLMKTHGDVSPDQLNMAYPYHSLSGYHHPQVDEDNKKKSALNLNRFKDIFSFSYLQKKHLIKHMTIIDSNEDNVLVPHDAPLNSLSAINLNDREIIVNPNINPNSLSVSVSLSDSASVADGPGLSQESDNRESDFAIEQPDPIAASLLQSEYLIALEEELYDKGLRKLTLLENGAGDTSLVLDAGEDLVLRLGLGEIIFRPSLEEVLQPIYWGNVGNLRYEILPKVEVTNINESDMTTLVKSLTEKGYDWHGANLDNIGIYHSSPIITDPRGIEAKK